MAPVPATAPAAQTVATVSFIVPARNGTAGDRLPSYISPSTQSVGISVNGGPPAITNTPLPGPYSVNVGTPFGSVVFTVTAFAGSHGTGATLSTGSTTQTIGAGGNTVSVVMNGVIASITNSLSLTAAGPPQVWAVNFVARDAASNVISGTYANPISITSDDLTGQTTLSTTNVTSSTTPVTLSYNQVGYTGACNYANLTYLASGVSFNIIPFAKGNKLVTNTADSGAGSFRQAMLGLVANDTISMNVAGTISLLSPVPALAAATASICGQAPSVLTINGAGASGPLFSITGGGATIAGLTIANFTNGGGNGGALAISASTTLNFVNFISNSVSMPGSGGAVSVATGSTVDILFCTFTGNAATTTSGGAIYATFPGPTVNITRSTFNGNSAQSGGAIYNANGTVNIYNSTITANAATSGSAGGVYNSSTGANTLIKMSTFYANTATAGARNVDNTAGGGVLTIFQNIFGSGSGTQDIAGPVVSGGYNILENNTAVSGGLVGTDANSAPVVGALANNGSLTKTMLPMSANLIDQIPSGSCVFLIDQRGRTRGLDSFCDRGAVEI